jgi:hypothetical protein
MKDRKAIALRNTTRSLVKKFIDSQSPIDYENWQKSLKKEMNHHNKSI